MNKKKNRQRKKEKYNDLHTYLILLDLFNSFINFPILPTQKVNKKAMQ